MEKFDFVLWSNKLNLTKPCRALIEKIRMSPPSRRVGGGRSNVCGRYPSKKMGFTIQFESHTIELSAIYTMEYDDNVHEYYDQPNKIKLNYISKNGRNMGVLHTPDFFVIRKDSAGWEEWKDEKELEELAVQSPNRYVKRDDGKWYCPPGEEYASQFGLYYKLRSSSEINRVFYRNLIFLEDYFRLDEIDVPSVIENIVINIVEKNPGIYLSELLDYDTEVSADHIYMLMVSQKIYVDFYNVLLATPDRVHVFISPEYADAYSNLLFKQSQKIKHLRPSRFTRHNRV